MQRVELTLIVVAAVIAVVIAGCGGGSGASATGEISVTVVFPEQSQPTGPAPQEMPEATNSVRIQVIPFEPGDGNGVIVRGGAEASQGAVAPPDPAQSVVPDLVITRDPDSTQVGGTVQGVPPGDYLVQALAYESDDGTGQVIARAMAPVTVVAGQTSLVHLVTDALVVSVEVMPSELMLMRYAQTQLAATCYDADHNIVMGNLQWSSDDPSVASVNPSTGWVAGQNIGTCTVTAEELSSGVEGSCEVTVYGGVASALVGDWLLIDEEEGALPAAVPGQVTKLSIESDGQAELWVGSEEVWCTGQIQAASGLGNMIWTAACEVPPPPELPPLDVEISFTYVVAGGQLTMVSEEPVGTAQATVQVTRVFVKLTGGPPSAVVGEWFGAPYDQPPSEWDSRVFMLMEVDSSGLLDSTDYYVDGLDQQVAESQLGSCFGAEAGDHLLLELEMSPVELKHMYYVSDSPCSNLLTLEDPYAGESPVFALRHPALDPNLVGGWFVLEEGTEMYINPDGTYSIEYFGEVVESGTIASYYACGPPDDFDGWAVFHSGLPPSAVVVGPVPVIYWGYELGPGIVTLHGFYLGSPYAITLSAMG